MRTQNIYLFWPSIPPKQDVLPKLEELLWPTDGKRPFIGEGAFVEEFEQKCSKKFGFDYTLFTNSATSALNLALLGANVNKGDEVITTSFTYAATTNVIILQGAKPVFVDIDQDSYNLDPSKILKKVTKKTKAIMPIHYGGQ